MNFSASEISQYLRHSFGKIYNCCKKIFNAKRKSVKLTIFLMRVMGLWHSSDKSEKFWSNFVLILVFFAMIYSAFVQGQELYYCRNSITRITFAALTATIILTETSKLMVFIVKRKKVMQLNEFVDNDFWKRSYTEKEQEIINDCENICLKSICLCLFLVLGTCFHYIIVPIIGGIMRNHKSEFPFPMRYIVLLYNSPYYEINFLLQILGTLTAGLCTSTFSNYLFAINLFTAAQFKILNSNFKSLCNFNESENVKENLQYQKEALEKLKKYINRHQTLIDLTKEIEDLYSYVMLEQVMGSVAQICFSGIQILLVKTTFQRKCLCGQFLISSLLQFLIYCYSSHAVYEESNDVSRAICFTKWFRITNPKLRKEFGQLMRIIAIRTHRPCILTVGKFYPLTLATFAAVLRTSVSYFAFLRQHIE